MVHFNKSLRLIFLICGFVLVILVMTDSPYHKTDSQSYPFYLIERRDSSNIYDGDTIQDVWIPILPLGKTSTSRREIWPGIWIEDSNVYRVIDIRLEGIDTPNKHPGKRGRTQASRTREKAAAAYATDELRSIVEVFEGNIYLKNPRQDKYAGRVIASLQIGMKDPIDISELLIDMGHGYVYNGNTKQDFDEWYELEIPDEYFQ